MPDAVRIELAHASRVGRFLLIQREQRVWQAPAGVRAIVEKSAVRRLTRLLATGHGNQLAVAWGVDENAISRLRSAYDQARNHGGARRGEATPDAKPAAKLFAAILGEGRGKILIIAGSEWAGEVVPKTNIVAENDARDDVLTWLLARTKREAMAELHTGDSQILQLRRWVGISERANLDEPPTAIII